MPLTSTCCPCHMPPTPPHPAPSTSQRLRTIRGRRTRHTAAPLRSPPCSPCLLQTFHRRKPSVRIAPSRAQGVPQLPMPVRTGSVWRRANSGEYSVRTASRGGPRPTAGKPTGWSTDAAPWLFGGEPMIQDALLPFGHSNLRKKARWLDLLVEQVQGWLRIGRIACVRTPLGQLIPVGESRCSPISNRPANR